MTNFAIGSGQPRIVRTLPGGESRPATARAVEPETVSNLAAHRSSRRYPSVRKPSPPNFRFGTTTPSFPASRRSARCAHGGALPLGRRASGARDPDRDRRRVWWQGGVPVDTRRSCRPAGAQVRTHRTGVTADGRLVSMGIEFILDGAAYVTLSPCFFPWLHPPRRDTPT